MKGSGSLRIRWAETLRGDLPSGEPDVLVRKFSLLNPQSIVVLILP